MLSTSSALVVVTAAFLAFKLSGYWQRRLFYSAHASEPWYRSRCLTPGDLGVPFEPLIVTASDGVQSRGFLFLQPKPEEACTAIYFHGNGGNVGDYLPRIMPLFSCLKMNVVMGSYRGYGLSDEDLPDELGMRLDAYATLQWVLRHKVLQATKIVLVGTSLGGCVAIAVAAANAESVDALILENTLLSFPKMLSHAFPFASPFCGLLEFLLTERWDAESECTKLRADLPVLFLAAKQDVNVPPWQFRQLYRKASGTKTWIEFITATHNDNHLQPNYYSFINEFMRVLAPNSPAVDETEVVETLVNAVTLSESFNRRGGLLE